MEFGGWAGAAEEAEGVRGQERAQGKECGVRARGGDLVIRPLC